MLLGRCDGVAGRMLPRDNGKKGCYFLETSSSSYTKYDYKASKDFCEEKGAILPEIRGPKDQANVKEFLKRKVRK